MRKLLLIPIALLCACLASMPVFASGEAVYTDASSGYVVVMEDDADLLSAEEEDALIEKMKPITAYGNVAFHSNDATLRATDDYIEDYYHELFGKGSGTVFFIDMFNRNIWIFSDGKVYKTITKSYANTITDNIYTYASRADYYTCAYKAFDQIYTLLEGGRIAMPMKYISNALLAITFSIIITYLVVRFTSMKHMPTTNQIVKKMKADVNYTYLSKQLLKEERIYDPPSSGSGGGGGGGCSSGGSSGGGGGHSF